MLQVEEPVSSTPGTRRAKLRLNASRSVPLGGGWVLAHSKSGPWLNTEFDQFRRLRDDGGLKLYHFHGNHATGYSVRQGACGEPRCGAKPPAEVVERARYLARMFGKAVAGFR
jgi:hypothetical protein